MHEQVNFSCKHCNCDATTKENLEEHQKSLHEVKMSKVLVHIELMKLLQMDILKNTRSHCMKISKFLVHIEPMKLLQREILKNTKSHCMKISKFLVYIEPMRLLQRDHL